MTAEISPETAALIASLPAHERELLEAFGVWRLHARPVSGTAALCRLSRAGDAKPALRPHILNALRAPDAHFTVEGVLATAEALLKGEPAPAGVIATAWGWQDEPLPPTTPSSSSPVEASTPAVRTAWPDSALGPADAPAPTLDAPAPEPVEADLDGEILAFAPAWAFEGQPERVFVRSRVTPTDAYAVTIKGGRATACSCKARGRCWHLKAAELAERWEAAMRRLAAREGLGMARAIWLRLVADFKASGRWQVTDAMAAFVEF